MGREIKQGLDYFPLDTDFFTNKKIKALRRAHGLIGILTYLNILCRIYANGYYFKFDDIEELSMDIAEDIANEQLKRVATCVTETINYLVGQGILAEGLFEGGIISGIAMQEQYVRSAYAAKRKIKMDVHLLVDVGDCIQKIRKKSGESDISSEEKRIYSEEIPISPEESTQSKSKSKNKSKNTIKEKNIKEKEIRHKYGEYQNVLLSDEDLEKLKNEFPVDYNERIERLSSYMASTGKSYKSHLATIRNWARNDKKSTVKDQTFSDGGSFDTADFYDSAIMRAYGEKI